MYQHPLIPLVLSVILIVLIVKQCITRKRLLRYRLLSSFLLTFVCCMLLVFESEIAALNNGREVLNWTLLALDIVIGILFILLSELSNSREQFNLDLFKTLDQTKLYLLIDRKNRIKDISSLFLEELGIENKQDVIRQNCFEVIERKYTIYKVNNTELTAKDLNISYQDPNVQDGKLSLELEDEKGDVAAFYFNETPIMVLGRFRGRILVGDKMDSDHLVGMQKNLAESTEELELIKNRFLTILEKTTDGIFFADLKKRTIWVNDNVMAKLKLSENEISLDEYYNHIHPSELPMVQEELAAVTHSNPEYSMVYRYKVGGRYVYVKEDGCRISSGHTTELCGILSLNDNYHFEQTGTTLDNIQHEDRLYIDLDALLEEGKTLEIVQVNVACIPEINEQYGRNIGNMVLSRYLDIIKKRYVEDDLIYRISGLDFVFIINSYNNMEKLKRDLKDEKILHTEADYGRHKLKIDAYMGICYSTDCANSEDAIRKVKECLRFSKNPQYGASYAFYKDIK